MTRHIETQIADIYDNLFLLQSAFMQHKDILFALNLVIHVPKNINTLLSSKC